MGNLSEINHLADNPFIWATEDYKRDLDILAHYKKDTALYISKMSGKPYDVCLKYVESQLGKGGRFELKDPITYYLHRNEFGDREKKAIKFSSYLGDAIKNEELIAATFTTYLPPHKKESLLVSYIDDNVSARSKAKKAMFAAKSAGDYATEILKKI
jgi:hypothetical protein